MCFARDFINIKLTLSLLGQRAITVLSFFLSPVPSFSSISIKSVVTHIAIGDALSFPIVSVHDTRGGETVRVFGFAFPDSQRGEKQSCTPRATHSLSKRSNARGMRVHACLIDQRTVERNVLTATFVIRSVNFANLHITLPRNSAILSHGKKHQYCYPHYVHNVNFLIL